MLRISTCREAGVRVARLEGRLSGPWVEELRRWWQDEVAAGPGALRVDLTDVAFIDAGGRALLEAMARGGVDLRACGCLTRVVRDQIVAAARPGGEPPEPKGAA